MNTVEMFVNWGGGFYLASVELPSPNCDDVVVVGGVSSKAQITLSSELEPEAMSALKHMARATKASAVRSYEPMDATAYRSNMKRGKGGVKWR